MASLKRTPFVAQAEVVQAITALLLDRNEQAAIINADDGAGKTMMAMASRSGAPRGRLPSNPRHLAAPPWCTSGGARSWKPHQGARVWVSNGPGTRWSSC